MRQHADSELVCFMRRFGGTQIFKEAVTDDELRDDGRFLVVSTLFLSLSVASRSNLADRLLKIPRMSAAMSEDIIHSLLAEGVLQSDKLMVSGLSIAEI